jgi:hypothetical protein
MTEQRMNRTAWAQLYEARRIPAAPESRNPGRPPAPIPRHKVGVTLSQAEVFELEAWQNRFSEMLGRKVSIGETIGILTRVCTTRLARLPYKQPFSSLTELVEHMVEQE